MPLCWLRKRSMAGGSRKLDTLVNVPRRIVPCSSPLKPAACDWSMR